MAPKGPLSTRYNKTVRSNRFFFAFVGITANVDKILRSSSSSSSKSCICLCALHPHCEGVCLHDCAFLRRRLCQASLVFQFTTRRSYGLWILFAPSDLREPYVYRDPTTTPRRRLEKKRIRKTTHMSFTNFADTVFFV